MLSKTDNPSLEQWMHLYELMAEIKQLAPWEYMYEDDLFGIQIPETDQLVFVSVMGNLGEHLSIAVYLGKKGFDGFWAMQDAGYDFSPIFFWKRRSFRPPWKTGKHSPRKTEK